MNLFNKIKRNNKYHHNKYFVAYLLSFMITLYVIIITVGYSAFKSEINIADTMAFYEPRTDIRITGININDFKDGALSVGEDYSKKSIFSSIELPNNSSEVSYDIKVTNFGNIEYGLYDIKNLPNNLEYEIDGLKEKQEVICEDDRCINGASKTIKLIIRYKENGYNSSSTSYNIKLDFDFRVFHKITYDEEVKDNIEDEIYPMQVMDGCDLDLTINNIDINVYGNALKLEEGTDYTFNNNKLHIGNVEMNLYIEKLIPEKAYLITKGKKNYYKEDTYREKIENVEFVHYINTDYAVKTYDLSTTKDEKIIGWLEVNENDNYDLYIGSTLDMALLDDSGKEMFAGMINLKSVEFNNLLDTSESTDMSRMFYKVPLLEAVNVSSFDTSNVKDMSGMFNVVGNVNYEKNDPSLTGNDGYDYMGKLILTGIENFDTSNVENMEWMFTGIANQTLDVSDFDTSKVTTLKRMFSNCWNLENLDVSKWNISNNTSLYNTFCHMHNIREIDISSFDTRNVTTIRGMFNDNMILENIILPENMDTSNVTNMTTVFANTPKLRTINISNWNTSKVTTMQEMFANAAALESIDLSTFDTRNVTSMKNMFAGTSSLTELDLSSFVTSKVTDMSNMFGYVKYPFGGDLVATTPIKLEKLDISHFDTTNVTTMESMFKGCKSLKELDLSNFNTGKVTNMSNMFAGLESIEKLNVSSFDTSKVTNMNYMFGRYTETRDDKPVYYYLNLPSIDVSNFDTGKVTNMSYMFSGLKSVPTLDISSFNTENVTTFEGLFQNMILLKEMDLSKLNTQKVTTFKNMFTTYDVNDYMTIENVIGISDLDYTNLTTMEAMFQRCSNMKEFTLENVTAPKLTSFTNMFAGTTALETLKIINLDIPNSKNLFSISGSPNLKYIDLSYLNGPLITTNLSNFFGNKAYLEEVVLDNVNLPKVTNISNAFTKDPMLTKVSMKNFDASGTTTMSSMFNGSVSLVEVNMSGIKTPNLNTMANMFQGATALEKVDFSGIDTGKVTNMSYMFNNCKSLLEIDLSDFNTPSLTNTTSMFKGATALKIINLSGFDVSKVTTMQEMFYSGASTLTMNIENIIGIEDFNPISTTNMTNMFAFNVGLTSLDLSSWNTPSLTNMSSMFQGALNLEKVDLSSFDTSKVTNMSNLFYSGNGASTMKLKEIKGIENFNFEKATNASGMFNRCTELEEITLNINGLALTNIQNMFYNDNGLKKVNLVNMNLPVYTNVTTFSSLFAGANNIEEINMSGLNAPLINSFGTMFGNKKLLTKIDLSNSKVPSLNTLSSLFSGNSSLKDINMTNMEVGQVNNTSSMFKSCVALETVDLSWLDTSNITNMSTMFYSGSDNTEMALKNVIGLDKFNFAKVTNLNDTFRSCRNLVGEITLNMDVKPSLSNTFTKTVINDGASLKIKYTDNTTGWINDVKKITISNPNITYEQV